MPSLSGNSTRQGHREHVRTRVGRCEHCYRDGELTSYETRSAFTVAGLRLFSTGPKIVLDECAACGSRCMADLRLWNRSMRDEIGRAHARCKQNPGDADAAAEAVRTLVRFRDADTLKRLAAAITGDFPERADLRILLGTGFEALGEFEEAEEAFRAACSLRNTPAHRETLAHFLLGQGRGSEAEPLLAHLKDTNDPGKASFLKLLAASYRHAGATADAERIEARLAKSFPEVAADRKTPRPELACEPIRVSSSASMIPGMKVLHGRAGGAPLQAKALLLPAAVAVLAVAYVISSLYIGRHREVWVVNGLAGPYIVSVAGQTVTVPPRRAVSTSVAEGEITVSVPALAGIVPDFNVDIRTSFWKRPFLRETFVINPDRTALLLDEETVYSENPIPNYESPYQLHIGEPFYRFRGIDYAFAEFPDEIRIEGGSTAKRQRVTVLSDVDFADRLSRLAETGGQDLMVRAMQCHLLFKPEEEAYFGFLQAVMDAEEYAAFLRPRLAVRPVSVVWHRAYQNAAEARATTADGLVEEYRQLLTEKPADGTRLYLLGRVVPDPAETERLFRAAAEAEPPCDYAFGALCVTLLGRGQFAEALDFFRRAESRAPENSLVLYARPHVLAANKLFDELLKKTEEERKESPLSITPVAEAVTYLGAANRLSEARELIDGYLTDIEAKTDAETLANCRNRLEAAFAYAGNRFDDFAEFAKAVGDPRYTWEAAATTGDLAAAAEAFAALPPNGRLFEDHLLLCLLALGAGNETVAADAVAGALTAMQRMPQEYRQWAALLEGSTVLKDPARLCDANLSVEHKRILLAVLAAKYPEHSAPLASLARTLNFGPFFPRASLEKALQAQNRGQ